MRINDVLLEKVLQNESVFFYFFDNYFEYAIFQLITIICAINLNEHCMKCNFAILFLKVYNWLSSINNNFTMFIK